jgi:uncharacterized membrane protein YfhO
VSVNVLRVNGNQIGVPLGRGGQAVEFTYRPWTFLLSIALAAMGGILVLMWALRIRRKEQN